MKKKSDYAFTAILTIAGMLLVYMVIVYLVQNSELEKIITRRYYALFFDTMIAGAVFFRERALWENENDYLTTNHTRNIPTTRKPLTNYLLRISWGMVIFFFFSFILSFTSFHLGRVPAEFKHLFRYPALWSFIIQGLLTLVGWMRRDELNVIVYS